MTSEAARRIYAALRCCNWDELSPAEQTAFDLGTAEAVRAERERPMTKLCPTYETCTHESCHSLVEELGRVRKDLIDARAAIQLASRYVVHRAENAGAHDGTPCRICTWYQRPAVQAALSASK